MGLGNGGKRPRARRRRRERAARVWARHGVESAALLGAVLVGVIAALGRLATLVTGDGVGYLVPFAGAVLALGIAAAALLRGWLAARPWLVRSFTPTSRVSAPSSAGASSRSG
jgi:hypothetical protein